MKRITVSNITKIDSNLINTEPLKFEKDHYLVRNINIEDDERDVLIVY